MRGTVDAVELDFLDPLLEAPDVDVTSPDGVEVAGLAPAELVGDDLARAEFEPLDEPGRYTVTYEYRSRDGALQRGAHQFTYAPGGDDGHDGDGAGWRPALAVAFALLLAGLVGRSVLAR